MFSRIFIIFISLVCVLLSFSWGKPIWLDEAVQFALAGYDTTAEAWAAFLATRNINHGQTGAYYMADFWLMHLFGASAFWLRFPSLLYGFLLFGSALYLFRLWKFSWTWQICGILTLFCNPWICDFIGEARPYIILAATTVGTLAYYCTPLQHRNFKKNPAIAFLGVFATLSGVVFHPYFSIYWILSCALGFLYLIHSEQVRVNLKNLVQHMNLKFCVVGVVVYLGLGMATWLGHSMQMNFDPFQWLPKQFSLPRYLMSIHFQSLAKLKTPFMLLVFGSLFFWKRSKKKLLFPTVLITSALIYSALLSYISYKHNYYILERQWIASIALVTLGIVVFAANFESLLSKRVQKYWAGTFLAWIAIQAILMGSFRVQSSVNWLAVPRERLYQEGDPRKVKLPIDGSTLEKMARANCIQGGPVWKIFREYYESSR